MLELADVGCRMAYTALVSASVALIAAAVSPKAANNSLGLAGSKSAAAFSSRVRAVTELPEDAGEARKRSPGVSAEQGPASWSKLEGSIDFACRPVSMAVF